MLLTVAFSLFSILGLSQHQEHFLIFQRIQSEQNKKILGCNQQSPLEISFMLNLLPVTLSGIVPLPSKMHSGLTHSQNFIAM